MKRSILEIYALAVCFFTVACFVIVLGMAVWNFVAISTPEFALNNIVWEQHQSDEAFKARLLLEHRYGSDKNTYTAPEGAALTAARDLSLSRAIASQRHGAIQDLVRNLIILLIDGIVFFIHWKLAARARQSAG